MTRPLVLALLTGCPVEPAPDLEVDRSVEPFPRCADSDPLRRPFFGDAHVHTALSLDASLQGNRTSPSDAYDFATGAALPLAPYTEDGTPLRSITLDRPLDWVALSDHAEFLGAVSLCRMPGSAAYDHPGCVQLRDQPDQAVITMLTMSGAGVDFVAYPELCGEDGADCIEAGMTVWQEIQDAAEAAYDRTDSCSFSSFVAYEWTGTPLGRNLHRNVIFRHDDVPDRALGYLDEPHADGLWLHLEEACLDQPPCDVLAIPHNSNMSDGLMFETIEARDDTPMTAELAARRAALEPLAEIYQHKGDSECWPGSPAADELCGFEKVPYVNLAGPVLGSTGDPQPRDFVRDALAEGMRWQQQLGVNPYPLGIIASTDSHLSAPGAVNEASFPGHGGAGQTNRDEIPPGLVDDVSFSPGGLAVLWAEENSREALFQAMRRKETYGTSGPRIVLRMFAGWDYGDDMCDASDFAQRGYDGGVPMGGTLLGVGSAPRFAVSALSDAGVAGAPGALLERIQLVKGWLEDGEARFAVVDVAGEDRGDLAPGSCDPRDDGSTELCQVYTDPDFDPEVPAFWYVRVLEQPTCRWHTLQCDAAGVTCPVDDPAWAGCCADAPRTQRERAWSSPVWYVPE